MTIKTNTAGKAWIALKGRLAQWTACKVMLPEENYKPKANETYIIAQFVATESSLPTAIQVTCSQPFQGFLNLSVMVPTDIGFDAHVGLAGDAADFFPNMDRYTYSDVTVRVNGRARVIGNPNLQAPWNRLEVEIPWLAWG